MRPRRTLAGPDPPAGRPRIWIVALALASGCGGGDGDPGPASTTVRDSAGVTIVEHAPLATMDLPVWEVDLDAAAEIGRVEGDPDYLFGRVVGFARLRDGRVAVADAMGSRIQVYGADGTYSETVGRPGQGPGEFHYLVGLTPHLGDSLLVVDFKGGRWTVLDPEGRYVRADRPVVAGWLHTSISPTLHGTFGDGTFLLGEFRRGHSDILLEAVRGQPVDREVRLTEDSVRFFRAAASGEVRAEFGTLPTERSAMARIDGQTYSWDGLRPSAFWAAHGEHFHYADATRFEILTFGAGGALARIVRVLEPLPPPARVPPEHLENPTFRELHRLTPLPAAGPAFGDMLTDAEGNLWIREPTPLWNAGATARWHVFASDGTPLAAIDLPSQFQATVRIARYPRMIVGEDYVLAVTPGVLGVQTLRLMPLRKEVPR